MLGLFYYFIANDRASPEKLQNVMAVTEVLTGFRQGQALVKRTKQWQFMKMASVKHQMGLRFEQVFRFDKEAKLSL